MAGARHRGHPRRALVVCGARLGRLLGLGPGRERLAAAVAHRYGVPPLGDDPRAARDVEGLECVADPRDRDPLHPRHVPRAVGDPRFDPRVRDRGQPDRLGVHCAALRDACRVGVPRRLAAVRCPALRGPSRFAPLARVAVPRQQPRLRGADLRRALGNVLPADLRGDHRQQGRGRAAVVRPLHRAARSRADPADGDRSRRALAPGHAPAPLAHPARAGGRGRCCHRRGPRGRVGRHRPHHHRSAVHRRLVLDRRRLAGALARHARAAGDDWGESRPGARRSRPAQPPTLRRLHRAHRRRRDLHRRGGLDRVPA
ncbi:unannotated protein [freshwater metagenome]|uniref:Unannotated protein n=1 Tax=freshwater metagenome TaxID=449393 RepID=A0A6J7ECP3_9ZZZZ